MGRSGERTLRAKKTTDTKAVKHDQVWSVWMERSLRLEHSETERVPGDAGRRQRSRAYRPLKAQNTQPPRSLAHLSLGPLTKNPLALTPSLFLNRVRPVSDRGNWGQFMGFSQGRIQLSTHKRLSLSPLDSKPCV